MSRAPAKDARESIADVVLRMAPRMQRFLARRRVPVADAEDLLQDTFLSLVRHWPAIECPEAWLMGSIRLRLYKHFQTKRRREWLLYVEPWCLEGWAPLVAAPQERAELLWDLMTLGRLLPRSHWLLVYFRFGLGLSTRETAGRLGYRPNSIQVLSARALRRLREGLVEGR